MAKKNKLVTYGLIAAGVVAAVVIIRKMIKNNKKQTKFKSTVEAGTSEKITEAEAESAITYEPQPTIKSAQSVIDVLKSLKRTPEQKAAAKQKRLVKKADRKKQPGQSQALGYFY